MERDEILKALLAFTKKQAIIDQYDGCKFLSPCGHCTGCCGRGDLQEQTNVYATHVEEKNSCYLWKLYTLQGEEVAYWKNDKWNNNKLSVKELTVRANKIMRAQKGPAQPAPGPIEYNGWTNYETWCVHLWLTNDKLSAALAQGCVSPEDLKEHVKNVYLEAKDTNLKDDMAMAALSEVDWLEIFEAFHPKDTKPAENPPAQKATNAETCKWCGEKDDLDEHAGYCSEDCLKAAQQDKEEEEYREAQADAKRKYGDN